MYVPVTRADPGGVAGSVGRPPLSGQDLSSGGRTVGLASPAGDAGHHAQPAQSAPVNLTMTDRNMRWVELL